MSLSKEVIKKINQNVIISMALNFGAIALAGLGLLNPVTGALVHNVGSVLVVINAALLLRSNNEHNPKDENQNREVVYKSAY